MMLAEQAPHAQSQSAQERRAVGLEGESEYPHNQGMVG